MRLLTVAFIFGFLFADAQKDSIIYFKEFGWTIHLPSDMKIIDAEVTAEKQRKGVQLLEGTLGKKVDSSDIVFLISAGIDKKNFFASNYSLTYIPDRHFYDSTYKAVDVLLYRTLRNNIPGEMDSVSSMLYVDSLSFNKYQVNLNINDKFMLHTICITGYLREHVFSFTSVFIDPKEGERMEKVFSGSTFSMH